MCERMREKFGRGVVPDANLHDGDRHRVFALFRLEEKDKRMKICLISKQFYPKTIGGAEVYMYEIYKRIKKDNGLQF